MRRKHISISPALDRMIQAQVNLGRYRDFSDAVQDAAWNYFIGAGTPFAEYRVTPEQVRRAFRKINAEVDQARKAGRLKPWKP